MTAVPSSRRPMMPLARAYAEQAFSRAAGAHLVEGNVLRVETRYRARVGARKGHGAVGEHPLRVGQGADPPRVLHHLE